MRAADIIIVQFARFTSLILFVSLIFVFFRPQSPSALPPPRGSCFGLALFPAFTALARLSSSASASKKCLDYITARSLRSQWMDQEMIMRTGYLSQFKSILQVPFSLLTLQVGQQERQWAYIITISNYPHRFSFWGLDPTWSNSTEK